MKRQQPWTPVDPLGEALHFLRMTGSFYCRSELTAPWGLSIPAMHGCLWFHVVTSGRCWLEVEGVEPLALLPGDLALVPHGAGHRLWTEPHAAAPNVVELPQLLMVTRKRGFLVMGRRELPDFKTTPCDGFGREVERGRVRRWSPRLRAS